MEACGLQGRPLLDLQQAVARKDSSAVAKLLSGNSVPEASRQEIAALPRLFGGREVLDEARRVVVNSRSRAALDNLCQVLEILDIHGVSDFLTIDLGETRGLEYHTGITFEGFVSGMGESVCSGGRYDNLTVRYGFPAPATGFTFNVLSLLQALQSRPEVEASTARDFLLFNCRDDRREVLEVAHVLRSQGYTAARDIIRREYGSSLEYARRMNIRCMLVIGEDPVGTGCRAVRIRDGRSISLSREQLQHDGLMKYIEESQGDE
jgi:ATP phosphoribosyltransferase regulatory subunit